MRIELNGEQAIVPEGSSVAVAVEAAGADGGRHGLAVAINGEVVPRSQWEATTLVEGQQVEVVAAIQGGAGEGFELGGRKWGSRLIVGTGGFRSLEQMEQALIALEGQPDDEELFNGLFRSAHKMKGDATIRLPNGQVRRVELHWYEAHGVGRQEMKVKRFLG